jgi:hypothetical protein
MMIGIGHIFVQKLLLVIAIPLIVLLVADKPVELDSQMVLTLGFL